MIDREVPKDTHAEEQIVGLVLSEPTAIEGLSQLLEPADFANDETRIVYMAALALFNRSEPVDLTTVRHELDRMGRLEDAGGLYRLNDYVVNLPVTVGVAEHYAPIVKRDAAYRRLIEAAHAIAQIGFNAAPDLEGSLAKVEQLVSAIRGEEAGKGFVHIREYLDPYLDEQEPGAHEKRQQARRKRSGIGSLDKILDGFAPSDFVVVAARTGVGKTALMLNIARAAAVNEGAKVAVFSLEMPGDQLAQRLLAAQAGVDSKRLRLGTHTEVEEGRIMHAHGVLSGAEIYVDDAHTLGVPQLRAKLSKLKRDVGLDLVIVDYLQLMTSDRGGRDSNRVQEISFITRNLKQLAREMDVPIIAGSQLSRALEQRSNHTPLLSDLRESGSIEQDADVVLFIHREDAYVTRAEWERDHVDLKKEPYPEGVAQLIVAKHRNGPTGTAVTRFHREISRFDDAEGDEQARML